MTSLRERLHQNLRRLSDDPEVYRDEQGLAAEDLKLILKYVGRHDIELNQEGFMYRRNQRLTHEYTAYFRAIDYQGSMEVRVWPLLH